MAELENSTPKNQDVKDEVQYPPFNVFKASMILSEVIEERERQHDKWGKQEHPLYLWISILTEEVGEAAKEANDVLFSNGAEATKAHKRLCVERLRKELVQVAAVAAATIEDIDNRWIKTYETP